MTPFWEDDHLTLYGGDCREVLRELPAESVHCVVTSPPYYSLRDYGVDGQIGLEATLDDWVASMVDVFRQVRRVLRKDGTLWLNLGDGFGDKQLLGGPWRVAFALQADGWYLRSDIIWSKPNPMPESVTDRPTKAHEYLFLLTRSPRYYYDSEAVREEATVGRRGEAGGSMWNGQRAADHRDGRVGGSHNTTHHENDPSAGRNLRSVWNIATEPYPGAHFATFPRKLVEPCVKAGTSERGVCPECGAPWVREVERGYAPSTRWGVGAGQPDRTDGYTYGKTFDSVKYDPMDQGSARSGSHVPGLVRADTTTGWRSSCTHEAEPVPAAVLDPFAGSGTTLLVAQSLGRRGVGIDLSPDYLKQALERNRQTPLGLVG